MWQIPPVPLIKKGIQQLKSRCSVGVCKHIILFKHYIYIYIYIYIYSTDFSDRVKIVRKSKRKCIDKSEIFMYSVEHNNVFIALVATIFGRYDSHKVNAIQNLKRLATCSA